MKSERPDLPLTIARLVRSATPVTPLARPSVRLEYPDSQAHPEVVSASWNKSGADGVLLDVTTNGPSGFRKADHRYQENVC